MLALFAAFAVPATHDYLAWNRARWAVLDDLIVTKKVDERLIDGGFEFNALRFYDAAYVAKPDRSWWWVQDDSYVLSFGPLPGYSEIGRRDFERWLPARSGAVYALQKFPRPPPAVPPHGR
jgi:hypothetical protein